MPRPKAFERDETLVRARDAFARHGYDATSIQQIVDITGLNRGSLYSEFGDKSGLFAAVIEQCAEATIAGCRETLEGARTPLDGILDFVDRTSRDAIANDATLGRLLIDTSIERAPEAVPAVERARKHLGELRELLTASLERARDAGQLGSSTDPDMLARYLLGAVISLHMLGRAGMEESSLRGFAGTVSASLRAYEA